MKWLPRKRFKDRSISDNKDTERSVSERPRLEKTGLPLISSNLTSQVGKIFFCLICTGMFLSGDGDRLRSTVALVSPQKLTNNVNRVASNISIRILDRDFLGSGFIVQKNGREYIAITNQHVLRAGEAPYTVETVDGKTYTAQVITDVTTSDYQYDLAILKFEADDRYETAKIGNSFSLAVGEPVFAAGFPYQETVQTVEANAAVSDRSQTDRSTELALKKGRVAIILDRALEEGYQIGYTNDVKKGMSGGPLLNSYGEVIGVNGKHAYPLWESPEIYQDGSEPCPALQELITRSSLAIPIEKTMELATLQSLELPLTLKYPVQADSSEDHLLMTTMQIEAEEIQSECRQEEEYPEPNTALEDFETP